MEKNKEFINVRTGRKSALEMLKPSSKKAKGSFWVIFYPVN